MRRSAEGRRRIVNCIVEGLTGGYSKPSRSAKGLKLPAYKVRLTCLLQLIVGQKVLLHDKHVLIWDALGTHIPSLFEMPPLCTFADLNLMSQCLMAKRATFLHLAEKDPHLMPTIVHGPGKVPTCRFATQVKALVELVTSLMCITPSKSVAAMPGSKDHVQEMIREMVDAGVRRALLDVLRGLDFNHPQVPFLASNAGMSLAGHVCVDIILGVTFI